MERHTVLAHDRPQFSMPDIVARMNWLADQTPEERQRLRDECVREGHIPTGERVMIHPPLETCYRCGTEYR